MPEYRLCRNGLHPMTPENTSVTTDGAERCKACRRDQARKRKEREVAAAAALMEGRFKPEPLEPGHDFELPLGTLGRKWTRDGKCNVKQINPAWFFDPILEDEAAAYCEGCPVINLCFAFAVIGKEKGVWGGTTEAQRDLLSLSQRLTIRQSYGKMYADYLGVAPGPDHTAPLPAMPYIAEWREDTILRGIEASQYEVVAGQAGFDKTQLGRQRERLRLQEAEK